MNTALKIVIPLAIIALAVLGFLFLGSLRPKPKTMVPPPVVPALDVITVSPDGPRAAGEELRKCRQLF